MIRKFFYLWAILTVIFMGSNLLYAVATHNTSALTASDVWGLLYASLLFMFFISLIVMLTVWWLGSRKQPQKQ